eukprot:TRINITY_DN9984_c0_g1_i2.p1 TRINITY_DN9984_c0_g1~~TRINITY_DN9984_c0_g1_i2.p1  ORF type:complete len:294 (-),score=50.63 TRINITY_DN9984_c0_g1_i2:253-1134(-)
MPWLRCGTALSSALGCDGRYSGTPRCSRLCLWADDDNLILPAKLMQRKGLASRREAQRLMRDGFVLVDGQVHIAPEEKVPCTASIELRQDVHLPAKPVVVLHKPRGILSAHSPDGYTDPVAWQLLKGNRFWRPKDNVMKLSIEEKLIEQVVQEPSRMAICGRLDKDSRGLLFMTEDGVVAKRLVQAKKLVKEYIVRCSPQLNASQLRRLNGPMQLDRKDLLPMCVAEMEGNPHAIRFLLREGRNRQIRRVVERVGSHVVDLFRIAVGSIKIGELPEGHWRLLAAEEVESGLGS